MASARIRATTAAALLMMTASPVFAAWQCSIHPPSNASRAELKSMARLSKSRAEKIALRHVRHAGQISEGELEPIARRVPRGRAQDAEWAIDSTSRNFYDSFVIH